MLTGIVRQVACGRGFSRQTGNLFTVYVQDSFLDPGGTDFADHVPEIRPPFSSYFGDQTDFTCVGDGTAESGVIGSYVYYIVPTFSWRAHVTVNQVSGDGLLVNGEGAGIGFAVACNITTDFPNVTLDIIEDPQGTPNVVAHVATPLVTDVHTIEIEQGVGFLTARVGLVSVTYNRVNIEFGQNVALYCNTNSGGLRLSDFLIETGMA